MTTWRKLPWTWARTAVGVAVVATLAACGGGGGGSKTATDTNTASVAGVASKGLMRNALVSAYAVKSDGTVDRSRALATDRTDSAGLYELRGLPAGQVVVIEVTVDGNTRMDDEATGTEITPAAGFTMRAAAVPEAGGTASVQVTPFSEMAVAIAEKNAGGLKADTVAAANAQVVLFVGGTDVLKEKPEFDADTKVPLNAAAVALAAVSKLAERGGLGCTGSASPDSVPGRATAAVAAPVDQATALKCVVEKLAVLGTEDDTPGDNQGVADELETSRQQIITQVGYTGTVPPVTSQSTLPPNLATDVQGYIRDAKALISSLRTTGATLGDKTDQGIAARLKAVGNAFDGVVAPLDRSSWTQIVTALAATNVLDKAQGPEVFTAIPKDGQGRFNLFNLATDLSGEVGGATVLCRFTNSTFDAAAQSPSPYLGCRATYAVVDAILPLPDGVDPTKTKVAIQHQMKFTLAESGDGVKVESRLIRQFGTVVSGNFVAGAETDVRPLKILGTDVFGTKEFKEANATRTCARTGGLITSCTGFSIVGTMAAGFTRQPNVGFFSRGTHQEITVNFLSSASGTDLTKLATTAEFKVMNGTTRLSTLAIKPGSEVIAKTATPGDVYAVSSALVDMARSSAKFIVEGVAADGATLTGTLNASSFIPDAAGRAVPTRASFQGVIKDTGGVKLFDGTLSAVMPEYLQLSQGNGWTVTLNGMLLTSGTNNLTVNLSATQDAYDAASGKRQFTIAGTYSENGTQKVILSGTVDELDPANTTLTFSTASGVSFTVTPGIQLIPIAKGSDKVAEYKVAQSLLVYADNSYERF